MAKKTIIHLSDLHIGLRQKESRQTRMVFDKIAESFPGVPIVITGDPLDKQISARGFISKNLARALKKSLQDYAGKTRIAFLHHHPFTPMAFSLSCMAHKGFWRP